MGLPQGIEQCHCGYHSWKTSSLQGLKVEGWEVIGTYPKYLCKEGPLTGAVAFGQGIRATPQMLCVCVLGINLPTSPHSILGISYRCSPLATPRLFYVIFAPPLTVQDLAHSRCSISACSRSSECIKLVFIESSFCARR